MNGSIDIEIGPIYHVNGPSRVRERITEGLLRGAEYSIRVFITTGHQFITSYSYVFGEQF
jgi:hypothetical protein